MALNIDSFSELLGNPSAPPTEKDMQNRQVLNKLIKEENIELKKQLDLLKEEHRYTESREKSLEAAAKLRVVEHAKNLTAMAEEHKIAYQLLQNQVDFHKQQQEVLKARQRELAAIRDSNRSDDERAAAAKLLVELQQKMAEQKQREVAAIRHINDGQEASASRLERLSNTYEKIVQYNKQHKELQKETKRLLAEQQAIIDDATQSEQERLAAIERIDEIRDDAAQRESVLATAGGIDSVGSSVPGAIGILSKTLDVVSKIKSKMDTQVDAAAKVLTELMPQIDARLQSQEVEYGFTKEIVNDIQETIGASRYVSQQKLTEKVVELVNSGVAYNVEQRALYATISDRMVTTFDALDTTLASMIRVQQADLTGSQLGSEALLTKLFNSEFQDTSYLTDMYDTVLSALSDAVANMDKDQATSFTYAVEKWLGALYSVGASSGTISSIAQGLNYLSTGDVDSLNSNSALSTLLNMSATNAGLSYSDLLTGNLDGDTVNDLMLSMVQYLASISENTEGNQVLRSQWSDVLGVSVTDLRAATNLLTTDISNIYSSTTDYATSMAETTNQTDLVKKRTATASQIDNLVNNFMYGIGMSIAESDGLYLTWRLAGALDSIQDAFYLQGTTAGKVLDLASGALMLGDTVVALFKELRDISIAGNDALSGFNSEEYNYRGGMYSGGGSTAAQVAAIQEAVASGQIITGMSYSGVLGDTSGVTSTGTSIATLLSNAEAAAVLAETAVTGTSEVVTKGADAIYSELFEQQLTPIRVKVASLESSALSQLAESLSASDVAAILQLLTTGKIPVDVDNSDVNSIINAISAVRGY